MAIIRTYWQQFTPREPWTRLSPNLQTIRRYLETTVGGQYLGGYSVRPIRGGTSWSSHAFGAAFDWRYENVGAAYREVGEQAFRAIVLPWLLANADALGIQQLHDYKAGRIWRSGQGWRASTAQHMGESWAGYIHVETNAHQWNDSTPITARGIPALTLTDTPPDPIGETNIMLRPVTFDHAMLTTSTPGPDNIVSMWQAILRFRHWQDIKIDGYYGKETAAAVENMQRHHRITVDGKLGPQSARAFLDR